MRAKDITFRKGKGGQRTDMTGLREGRILRVHLNDLKTDGLHATTGKRKSRKHVYPWTEDLRDVL